MKLMKSIPAFLLALTLTFFASHDNADAQLNFTITNLSNCGFTVDFTTNQRFSTGPAVLPPNNVYSVVPLSNTEFVTIVRVNGTNYPLPFPGICVPIVGPVFCAAGPYSLCIGIVPNAFTII